ncbi:hypothetical protein ACFOZ7_17285 [Natribaculum luteum]|uniref:Beta-ketoadipyl CoA thiolase n=1 Tax=Natribaculum luteum TaxID=1586232 RepID=A0ABD5P406_9EURY|nr:hypothetical protein [Natribaculum luteum]
MGADTIALGVIVAAVGVVFLYLARNVYPRLGIADESLELLRITTAVIAGGLITFGLVVVALGFVGG